MQKNAIRACPVCSNHAVSVLHNQKFIIPMGMPLPDEYDIVCCQICCFIYADTPNSQQQYEDYYTNHAKYTSISTTPEDQRHYAETSAYLGQYLNKNHKVLDIGCSNGGLLKKLKEQGYLHLTGIDPVSSCIQHLHQYGLQGFVLTLSNIHQYSLLDIEPEYDEKKQPQANDLGTYDFIILSHVMEHLVLPDKMLIAMHALLNKNGKIYMEVPNAAEYRNKFYKSFHYFDVEHINHFDQVSLKNLATQNGFEVLAAGHKVIPISSMAELPAVYSVLQSNPDMPKSPIEQCHGLKQAMQDYITLSRQAEDMSIINELADSGEPIILWGIGSYAQNLLKTSRLRFCNIVEIIDRDPKKQTLSILNKLVKSPQKLLEQNYPEAAIVIASVPFAKEIAAEISAMHLNNRIITV